MFAEGLQCVLQFIGVRSETDGCTSAELSEFLCEDVLPYCGWAANTTLRDTLVRLLLSEHADVLHLYELPGATESSSAPSSVAAGAPASSSGGRADDRHSRRKPTAVTRASGGGIASSRAPPVPLVAEEVIRRLDRGEVRWLAAPSCSPEVTASDQSALDPLGTKSTVKVSAATTAAVRVAGEGTGGAAMLRLCPTRTLQERAFGFSLRTQRMRETADFIANNTLRGWPHLGVERIDFGRCAPHLVRAGLNTLKRTQAVSLFFMLEPRTSTISNRYFPAFAPPLSREEGDGGDRATVARREHLGDRCTTPLASYYARQRYQGEGLPGVVFDLGLIKFIITSSPDRKLLLQDAVHAILSTHDVYSLHWSGMSKTERNRFRRMLVVAGLRIVVAVVNLRGARREVQLVIPAEDLLSRLPSNSRRRGSSGQSHVTPGSSRGGRPAEGGDGGDKEEFLYEYMDAESTAGSSRSSSNVATDDDEEGVLTQLKALGTGKNDGAMHRMIEAANEPVQVSPDLPLELQVGRTAECRHVALMSVFPRITNHTTDLMRRKALGLYMEHYSTQRQTLSTSTVLSKGSKAFTLVYGPKGTQADATAAAAVDEKTTRKRTASVVKSEGDVEDTAMASAAGEPKQPAKKSVSAYALNVVLELLEHSPHRALTVGQLIKHIDISTLHQRVLPRLKELGKVTTTGVTPYAKARRVGLVVLAGTVLDEETKQLVMEAARSPVGGTIVAAAMQRGCTSAIPTSIVLSSLPPMTEGVQRSETGRRLMQARSRTRQTVNKVMMVRNGFARHTFFRAGRLHLELWKQWYQHRDQHRVDHATAIADVVLNVQGVYEQMSLSTFCIVIGLHAVDVAAVLQRQFSVDVSSASAEGFTAATSAAIGWGTPLCHLPPTVRAWCQQRGAEMLLHALGVLQQRDLILCKEERISALSSTPLDVLSIRMASHCSLGAQDYALYAAHYTPGSTMYMTLRYWSPVWAATTPTFIPQAAAICETDPNVSVPKLIALQKVLRVDAAVLAESVYQRCGIRHRSVRGKIGLSSQAHVTATSRQRVGRQLRGDRVPQAMRQTTASRVEMTGATVADAVERALRGGIKLKRVSETLGALERTRRVHLASHSLGLPHSIQGQTSSRVVSTTSVPGTSPHTLYPLSEYDLSAIHQGSGTYNRFASHTVLHAAVLGDVVRQLSVRHTPVGVATEASATANGGGDGAAVVMPSFTNRMTGHMMSTFSPDLSAPSAATSGGGGGAGFQSAAQLQTRPINKRHPAGAVHQQLRDGALMELAMDALRMVLLTDKAHYRLAIAKEVLSLFPPRIVSRARNALNQLPAFRRKGPRGRIPELALRSGQGFLPAVIMRAAPRQCANAVLLHDVLCGAEEDAVAATLGVCSGTVVAHCLHPRATQFDVSVVHQPVADVLSDSSPSGPATSHIEEALAQLHLPTLAWPPAAYELERSRAHDGLTAHPRNKRPRSEDEEANGIGEDATVEVVSRQRDTVTAESLYPARSLSSPGDPPQLSAIPTDPPSGPAEAEVVAAGMRRVQNLLDCDVSGGSQGPSLAITDDDTTRGCAVEYPSVFHHVDGTFHTYVWKAFLTALYRYVLRVPGVSHADLALRMTANGLISGRCFEAGVRFLVACGVLRRGGVGSGALPADIGMDDGEYGGPFAIGGGGGGSVWHYTATVHAGGLWDLTHLDDRIPRV